MAKAEEPSVQSAAELRVVFRADGSLESETTFCGETRHGPFRRFHPDGSLAREGSWVGGQLDGDIVAYVGALGASTSGGPEPLRPCCVPAAAVKLVTTFHSGIFLDDAFFDREGRRLQEDGKMYPDLPPAVPVGARFLADDKRWESGVFDAKGRTGVWLFWNAEGQLLERTHFAAGKREGLHEQFVNGRLHRRAEYVAEQLHGELFEKLSAGDHLGGLIARSGSYQLGRPVGLWKFFAEQERVVAQQELGVGAVDCSPASAAFVVSAHGRELLTSEEGELRARALLELARHLEREKKFGVALLVRLRAELFGGSPAALLAGLPQMTAEASERWSQALRADTSQPSEHLGALVIGLQRGVCPSVVLRELSSRLMCEGAIAVELATLAVQLAPGSASARGVKVLALMQLGRLRCAQREVDEVRRLMPEVGEHLAKVLEVTFPTFDFWPAREQLPLTQQGDFPTEVTQDLAQLQHAFRKLSLRLHLLRERLRVLSAEGDPAWLPPPLPGASADSAPALEHYEFYAGEGEAHQDLVLVDERLLLDGQAVVPLMRLARLDWLAACWLCFAAGMTEVGMPQQLAPAPTFGHALAAAMTRAYRAQDQLQSMGLRSRRAGVPSFRWEGLPIEDLEPSLLLMAQRESLEMRAALYFAADGTCRSLWQDDLRV